VNALCVSPAHFGHSCNLRFNRTPNACVIYHKLQAFAFLSFDHQGQNSAFDDIA
jgi:hypothetical protein